VENLKLAFVVLGALKTFYAPAKDWVGGYLFSGTTSTVQTLLTLDELAVRVTTDGSPLSGS
jgi:hypothetical protein